MVLVDASGSMRYGSRTFEDASGAGHTLSPDGRNNWSKFDHATAFQITKYRAVAVSASECPVVDP